MSFAIFKSNMLMYMENQGGIKSHVDFAKKLTMEYDMAIRRGYQIGNSVSIAKPNTEFMISMVTLAGTLALQKKDGLHHIINDIGKGVVGYWTGATLNNFPIPIMPAFGAYLNLFTVTAMVSKPGQFPDMQQQPPTDNTGQFLDMLIMAMQIHLTTIEGIYFTISLYPGFPILPPAPGIVQWVGYTVPPAPKTVVVPIPTKLAPIQDTDFKLSADEIASKKEERKVAQKAADDVTAPIAGREAAGEYVGLMTQEIDSGKSTSIDVETTPEIIQQIEEEIPLDALCEVGKIVVGLARKDIGIVETDFKNYGGFPGGIQKKLPGRIDSMMTNTGLNNQAHLKKSGEGFYWCAGAVTTWWKEAGLTTPKGSASCQNWMVWAKANGQWSNKPKVGAAILYGKPSHANHIGIVSAILPNGDIMSVQGNTSSRGQNRNGGGVYEKISRGHLGFVIPTECK